MSLSPISIARFAVCPSSRGIATAGAVANALLLGAVFALPSFAAAQAGPAQPSTPYLSGTCTNCHGTQVRGAGGMPSLAGLPQSYIVEQMNAFREGRRTATIMNQIARGYTDQQIALLAEYFARQTPER